MMPGKKLNRSAELTPAIRLKYCKVNELPRRKQRGIENISP